MFDFDPRDYDSRDEDRLAATRDRGGRGGSDRDDERDDPREVFTRHLNLPRGLDRQLVRDRDREYTLRGSEEKWLFARSASRKAVARARDATTLGGSTCGTTASAGACA